MVKWNGVCVYSNRLKVSMGWKIVIFNEIVCFVVSTRAQNYDMAYNGSSCRAVIEVRRNRLWNAAECWCLTGISTIQIIHIRKWILADLQQTVLASPIYFNKHLLKSVSIDLANFLKISNRLSWTWITILFYNRLFPVQLIPCFSNFQNCIHIRSLFISIICCRSLFVK